MDEPLLAWIFLLLVMIWGTCTGTTRGQERLRSTFGKFTPLVQWYNVTFALLLLLFLRTLMDIVRFEYISYRFLSWEIYKDNLDAIPLIPEEKGDQNSLVIPTWIRVISLMSPIAGLAAFGYATYQVVLGLVFGSRDVEKPFVRFLHMVVLGMPLLYIVMALRATLRMWAVMTGSCWLPYKDKTDMTQVQKEQTWEYLKRAEKATWTQDLEVASGFQFFAVWCFGQVCSQALRSVVSSNATNNDPEEREDMSPQSNGGEGMDNDRRILTQLGIIGIHSFVVLGVAKTIVNVIIAVASLKADWQAGLEPVEKAVMQAVDPVFIFATILSVVNMLLLGRMERVSDVLPNVNTKFNATRALLLIGQGQFTVLRAAISDGAGTGTTSKILKAFRKVPFLENLNWWFNINQARLLHSSLLCFECLAVVIVNAWTWKPIEHRNSGPSLAREARKDPRTAPLLLDS